MLVLSVVGPIGTVSAQTVSISQTAQGDTTVAPGETITVEATMDYADMNSPAIDVTLPDGWEVVEHTDDGGTYGPPQPAWLWLEGSEDGVNGSHTVSYTVEVPEDAEPGDYTFSAEGSGKDPADDSDVEDTDDLTVTVEDEEPANEPPEAAFDASPADPEAGEDVTFDASASDDPDGSVESYEWEFGDGDTDTGEEVTHAFDEAGDYDVELTVTDDDGDTDTVTETISVSEPSEEEEAPGAAEIQITPDTGTEASTYSGGAFEITNTGEQDVTSVTIDLSESAMPDMVWDPDGTAGDSAAKGLVIDSESGDGVGVESTADDDVFSEPHNGVNGSDGYDVMTIEFDDFEPGESVSFSADNDPTSIKDATITSQEAGPVSGLELARSTVSVEYDDDSTQETQLFGDGSEGGAQASASSDVPDAPSIDVQDVDLDDGALRDHHSAATVSEADQTVTITGEPDETVTLLHHESELELDNVPDYGGTPGYDIEEYEANKIENADYQTVTLDSNGEAEVPVTLLNTTDVGGYNYLVAAHGEPDDLTGMNSDVVVLQYDEDAAADEPADGETAFAVNAGGDAYTAEDGTEFQADANFDGGDAFTTGNSGTPSDPEVTNTSDDELYHTERYGDFSYDAPLEDGEYEVTLHFAEIYQGVANNGGEGDRLFDASIEGEQVLDEYDIYAEAGGEHAAITETFTVEVTDGELNVDFETVEDNAKVSAIEVEQVEEAEPENEPPEAAFDASPADPEVGEDVTFDASASEDPDGTIESYEWDFGDGENATGEEVTHAFDDAGDYDVELTVTDDDGESNTTTQTVTVEDEEPANEPPEAAFDASPADPEVGEDVTFDASGSTDADGSIESYEWEFDDGENATGEEVTHAFDDAGDYDVELTVTDDDGESNTTTQTVTVSEAETEPMSIEEAVAGLNDEGDDAVIETQEIQQAIDLWAEDEPVPNTDGEVVSTEQLQQLIDMWQEDEPVTDADGDTQ